ncbi:CBS and ACT domain-containing protein [Vagococcus acidifermentans]|uniref:CBS domain-containing protein n=1 Tax=Vagococcus acidifermentans TaxID=564710 RepID=A0A430ATN8_9ENTE|nr:CBS and ACT domain-containing protein [Vagococcus acidifermentans]RSU11416.1 hypothetical protein CBF27_07915 [Vagococcus acidifermentans]
MIVENYMAKDVITVSKATKIFDAVELMNQNDIHRLPVVEDGKLVGLITEGTIQSAMPSQATSLSVYEVNYLLNKTTVADIMIKEVETIQADALLEDAISKMRQHNIGVLPVMSPSGEVMGIITNNDIFDAFLEITGYNQPGTRVSIAISDDHEGVLADLTTLFAENHINIVQIVVYRKNNQPTIVIQLANPNDAAIVDLLSAKGYEVISCVTTTAAE